MRRLLRSSIKKDARRADVRGEYRPHSIRLSAPHFAAGCPPIRDRIVGSAGDFLPAVTQAPPLEPTTPKAEREILSIYYNYLHLAGKSLKSPALERIGPGERIFAEYSVTAPATRISKPLRIHGNFVGPSGGESVFVPRKWRPVRDSNPCCQRERLVS
jgi:hypothetical protein